jgi:hypothetical protein
LGTHLANLMKGELYRDLSDHLGRPMIEDPAQDRDFTEERSHTPGDVVEHSSRELTRTAVR